MFIKKYLFAGITKDFFLNLLASLISSLISQIIVYPILAKYLTGEDYGLVLTIMAVANTIIVTCGNSLNNTRLIMQSEYVQKHVEGDFNFLCIILSIVSSSIFAIYLILNNAMMSVMAIALMAVFVGLGVIRMYGAVEFRININYLKNLWLNIFVSLGNLIGVLVFCIDPLSSKWVFCFLIGEIFGVFYLLTSPIFKEKWKLTHLLKKTISKESILAFTTLVANLMVYLDRLLLYPVLGGESVAVYSVASFFGKSLGIVITPLSGVLLSYYAKKEYIMSNKKFNLTCLVTLAMAAFSMLACFILAKPITGLLYPQIISEASSVIYLANMAAIITVAANLIMPAVLKFANTIWQIFIQVIYVCIYLGLGIVVSKKYGLAGFAYVAIIASTVKFIVVYFVGIISISKSKIQINEERKESQS